MDGKRVSHRQRIKVNSRNASWNQQPCVRYAIQGYFSQDTSRDWRPHVISGDLRVESQAALYSACVLAATTSGTENGSLLEVGTFSSSAVASHPSTISTRMYDNSYYSPVCQPLG